MYIAILYDSDSCYVLPRVTQINLNKPQRSATIIAQNDPKSLYFQLYHGENKLIFNEMMTIPALY